MCVCDSPLTLGKIINLHQSYKSTSSPPPPPLMRPRVGFLIIKMSDWGASLNCVYVHRGGLAFFRRLACLKGLSHRVEAITAKLIF